MGASTEKPEKLTITSAPGRWAECQRAMDGLKALRDEAAAVMLEHAERTGKRAYKDLVAVIETGGNLVLDQAEARKALPAGRLVEGDLLKRQKRGLSLKLPK